MGLVEVLVFFGRLVHVMRIYFVTKNGEKGFTRKSIFFCLVNLIGRDGEGLGVFKNRGTNKIVSQEKMHGRVSGGVVQWVAGSRFYKLLLFLSGDLPCSGR